MGFDTALIPLSSAFLALVLFSGPAAAQSSAAASSRAGIRRVELRAEPAGDVPEVRVSPELSTTFLFDSELQGVELEGRDRFQLVDIGQATLRLVPSAHVEAGTPLRLKVYFKDGAVPANAAFMLVTHPAQPESLVEVYRQKRTLESYRQEAKEAREEASQCREESERLHAECKGSGGLRGLLATRVLDGSGVMGRDIGKSVIQVHGEALPVMNVFSYRAARRVAVELVLAAPEGAAPWAVEGAALTSKTGDVLSVLPVWQSESLTSEPRKLRVVVEAEALENDARGSFVLKLWGAGGKRTVTLSNVTFP
ncbi:DUF2381 family protein [Myxococcaceae bacterium GXIMD 01537]